MTQETDTDQNTEGSGEPGPAHFKGRTVPEHLIEARKKGALVREQLHGGELPGFLSALADSTKEGALLLSGLTIFATLFEIAPWQQLLLMLAFFFFFLIWRGGRRALLGWTRLEQLHRLIEEERWEIENHRPQERDELREIYRLKGFEGKLLEQVLDVLMANDDRLLKVMLEEELGLSLACYPHPLQQALGAMAGVIISVAGGILVYLYTGSQLLMLVQQGLSVIVITCLQSRWERGSLARSLVWTLSLITLALGGSYFALMAFPDIFR